MRARGGCIAWGGREPVVGQLRRHASSRAQQSSRCQDGRAGETGQTRAAQLYTAAQVPDSARGHAGRERSPDVGLRSARQVEGFKQNSLKTFVKKSLRTESHPDLTRTITTEPARLLRTR